jgi:tetratricopeptide (TPR) repeat protein
MTRTTKLSPVALAFAGVLAVAPQLLGQGDSVRVVRAVQAIDSALVQQRAGNYVDARRNLSAALTACGPSDAAAGCRGRVNYGLGYVAQIEGASSGVDVRTLTSAIAAYRAVLTDFPGHADALKGIWIAYNTLGGARADTLQLRRALAADPARRSAYLRLIGDYYASRRDLTAARASYRSAMQASPTDPEPVRRLILTYDLGRPAQADSLMGQLAGVETTFPGVALDAYQRILESRVTGAALDGAIARWLDVASQRRIAIDHLMSALPADVSASPPINDLRQYLARPWSVPASTNWWMRTSVRRLSLARLALALGDRMVGADSASSAAQCWSIALTFGGGSDESAPILLDLQRSLAVLYSGHPEVEGVVAKLAALENAMFQSKAMFIASHDSLAQQRFHTALGIIFAQRKQWRSSQFAHDAIFQLEAALRVAGARDASTRTYQPLPLLHELLAAGYQAIGDGPKARTTSLRAAQSYLDVDDIARADSILAGLNTAPADPMMRLVRRRDRIARLSSRVTESGECEVSGRTELESLPAAFAARQRFKLLATCATLVSAEARVRLASGAVSLATSTTAVLTGVGDLARLDEARSIVSSHLGIRADAPNIVRGSPRATRDSAAVNVAIWLGDEPSFIPLRSQDRIAANVAAVTAGVGPGLEVRIWEGNVRIISVPTGVQREALGAQIKRVPGVAGVSFIRSGSN